MSVAVETELKALRSLARVMGVHTRYINGLGKRVTVAPETLVRICAALGAPLERPSDAGTALREHQEAIDTRLVPPVLVAWDGALRPFVVAVAGPIQAHVELEDGPVIPLV